MQIPGLLATGTRCQVLDSRALPVDTVAWGDFRKLWAVWRVSPRCLGSAPEKAPVVCLRWLQPMTPPYPELSLGVICPVQGSRPFLGPGAHVQHSQLMSWPGPLAP